MGKDGDKQLSKVELRTLLQSLGLDAREDEVAEFVDELGGGKSVKGARARPAGRAAGDLEAHQAARPGGRDAEGRAAADEEARRDADRGGGAGLRRAVRLGRAAVRGFREPD